MSYSWTRVRHAEAVIREKFHGDGLTTADHEKIREMCRAVFWNKKKFLYFALLHYMPQAQIDYYFDGWTPSHRNYKPLSVSPLSFSTATRMIP